MFISNKDFKVFFLEYYEAIYRFSRKYTGEDAVARDIAQDSFIRLYERQDDFEVIEAAKSFVYTTAKNLCLDYLKHQKIKQQYSLHKPPEEENRTFLHEITYQETLRNLYRAIDDLPQQTRQIILLHLDGNNNNEIAENLDISVNTVKTLKKAGYKKMKDSLGKDFFIVLLFFLH